MEKVNKIVLLGKSLLIKVIQNDSTANIIAVSQNNYLRGQICKVGNGYSCQEKKYDLSQFKEGDIVVFRERSAQSYTHSGVRYVLVEADEVLLKEEV